MRTTCLILGLSASLLGAGPALSTEHESDPAAAMAPQQAPPPAALPSQGSVDRAALPSQGSVDRAALTLTILDREPQGEVSQVTVDQGQIFYFTEVTDMPGETVVHRWEFEGQVLAEVPFEIGSTRWRTYSSKDLLPAWIGDWTVSTLDASGRVLDSRQFSVLDGQAAPALPAAPADPE